MTDREKRKFNKLIAKLDQKVYGAVPNGLFAEGVLRTFFSHLDDQMVYCQLEFVHGINILFPIENVHTMI